MPTKKPNEAERRTQREIANLQQKFADSQRDIAKLQCDVTKWQRIAFEVSRVLKVQSDALQRLTHARHPDPDEIPF